MTENRNDDATPVGLYDVNYLNSLEAKFLSDEPEYSDAINGLPHQHVADRIFEYISNADQEKDPKAIALLGDWGSGKSSIIRMLKGKAEGYRPENDKWRFLLFEFDAWEHEGDSLRVAFLEKLGCFREDGKLTSAEKVARDGARKLQTAKVSDNLSKSTWIILGVLGVAISAFFISKFVFHADWSNEDLTLITAAFTFFAAILVNQKQSYQEIKHTSLEFEQAFSAVLKELGSQYTLIVVIDNLDRLDADQAKKCWSTVQGLTRQRKDTPFNYFFIVPIRTETAGNLFDDMEYGLAVKKDEAKSNKGKTQDRKSSGYGSKFFEKLFPVVFRTPRLVTTNWIGLLDGYLKKAFQADGHEENLKKDLEVVRSVFGRMLAKEKATNNPRDIKHYVNRLVALTKERSDLPLAVKAIYLFFEDDIRKDPREFFGKKSDECISLVENVYNVEDEALNWAPLIASLFYNVEIDKAKEILFDIYISVGIKTHTPGNLRAARQLFRGEPKREKLLLRTTIQNLVAEGMTAGEIGYASWFLFFPFPDNDAEKKVLYSPISEYEEVRRELEHCLNLTPEWSDVNSMNREGISVLIPNREAPDLKRRIPIGQGLSNPIKIIFPNGRPQAQEWTESLLWLLCRHGNGPNEGPLSLSYPVSSTYLHILDSIFTMMARNNAGDAESLKRIRFLKYTGDLKNVTDAMLESAESDAETFIGRLFALSRTGQIQDISTWGKLSELIEDDLQVVKNEPQLIKSVEERRFTNFHRSLMLSVVFKILYDQHFVRSIGGFMQGGRFGQQIDEAFQNGNIKWFDCYFVKACYFSPEFLGTAEKANVALNSDNPTQQRIMQRFAEFLRPVFGYALKDVRGPLPDQIRKRLGLSPD